jgi:hypothetical protein
VWALPVGNTVAFDEIIVADLLGDIIKQLDIPRS